MSEPSRGSNRRAVLKGAAWTAPAIVLATAAPAFAASGAASITQAVSGVVDDDTLLMTTTVRYVNANTGATPATAIVRLSASAGRVATGDPTSVGPGWAFVGVTPVGSAAIREYTFAGTIAGADSPSTSDQTDLVFTVLVETASVAELSAGTIRTTTTVNAPATVNPNPTTGGWGPLPAT